MSIAVLALLWALYRFKKYSLEMELAEPNEPISTLGSISMPGYTVPGGVPKTANFSVSEFNCKDRAKTPVPAIYYSNLQELMDNLQVLRSELGGPIMINSGYRTAAHNKAVGGAKYSQHLVAKAADIRASGFTPSQIKSTIERLISEGRMRNGGIGLYKTFVHYDIGSVRRW